jgi:transcriptional regulator with XRE-family HTH domain
LGRLYAEVEFGTPRRKTDGAPVNREQKGKPMPNRTIFQNDDQDTTLGGRISLAREASGLSVTQVVKRLGVRSATYAAWEADRSEPRANKLVALAGILNVSPPYLLGGLGTQPDTGNSPEADKAAIAQRLSQLEKTLKEARRTARELKALLAHVK